MFQNGRNVRLGYTPPFLEYSRGMRPGSNDLESWSFPETVLYPSAESCFYAEERFLGDENLFGTQEMLNNHHHHLQHKGVNRIKFHFPPCYHDQKDKADEIISSLPRDNLIASAPSTT